MLAHLVRPPTTTMHGAVVWVSPAAMTTFLKMVIVGNTRVGKTSLCLRYCQDKYTGADTPTIGASFGSKSVTVGGRPYAMHVWDTAGVEVYRSMSAGYVLRCVVVALRARCVLCATRSVWRVRAAQPVAVALGVRWAGVLQSVCALRGQLRFECVMQRHCGTAALQVGS